MHWTLSSGSSTSRCSSSAIATGMVHGKGCSAASSGSSPIPSALAAALLDDYRDGFPRACVLFPDAVGTLSSLRASGLKLGLITNGSVRMQSRKLECLALSPMFDTILISDAEGIHKPDPRIFQRAMARLGVRSWPGGLRGRPPRSRCRRSASCGNVVRVASRPRPIPGRRGRRRHRRTGRPAPVVGTGTKRPVGDPSVYNAAHVYPAPGAAAIAALVWVSSSRTGSITHLGTVGRAAPTA